MSNPYRRKKKRRHSKAPVIILTVLLLLVTGFSAGYYFFGNLIKLPGTWHRNIDITDSISLEIENYLREAAGGSEIRVSDFLKPQILDYSLTLKKDGTFVADISDSSYEECLSASKEALRESVLALITQRMELSSIDTDIPPEDLVSEALGMSIDEYLEAYAPTLLSPLSDYKNEYFKLGTFSSEHNLLKFVSEDGKPLWGASGTEFLISADTLVLNIEGTTYIFKKN